MSKENVETPLISVITVCRNAESTIGRTMRSVRHQDCNDVEHLVIDGASTDDTLAVVRSDGREDVRIVSEPDKGLYDAMNKGLAAARGKYVIFLNAGDTFADNSVLSRYAARARQEADIIYGDTLLVDDDGLVVGPRHLSAPERLDSDSFRRGMLICHQAFMVRRNMAPRYDTTYRFSADYDWCIRCIRLTTPDRCHRLGVTIHYLKDGLTGSNHTASLRERFNIMAHHYGTLSAIARHLSFVPRMVGRKLRALSRK